LFAENECGTVLVDTEQRKPLRKLALSPTMAAN
jgi:hypothetical protein